MDIALFEVGLAVGDADGCDRAITVEVYVVFEKRWEAMVGLDTVELDLVSLLMCDRGEKVIVVLSSRYR